MANARAFPRDGEEAVVAGGPDPAVDALVARSAWAKDSIAGWPEGRSMAETAYPDMNGEPKQSFSAVARFYARRRRPAEDNGARSLPADHKGPGGGDPARSRRPT